MNDKLVRKLITEFAALRPKTYSYLTDDNDENKKKKKKKKTQKLCLKQKITFEDYEHRLEATQRKNKVKQLEKNKADVNSLAENHKELIKKQ